MKKEEEKLALLQSLNENPPKEQNENKELRQPEISEESRQERLFLTGMLIQQTDDLAKAKQKRKKTLQETKVEINGVVISIGEIQSIISTFQRKYEAMFPNDVPFFHEIYRLNQWDTLNPNDFHKPAIVGKWINEIIYSRFHKDVLPALRVMNPKIPGSFVRKGKLYHFLNDKGIEMLIQFRDESIILMKESTNWYEFRKKLLKKYGVGYQSLLFQNDSEGVN